MKNLLIIILGLVLVSCSEKYNGIDISHHNKITQKEWDYLTTRKNIKFVFIKASDGASFKDPMFLTHYSSAKRKNLLIGAYHFYRDGISPELQFKNFQQAVKNKQLDLIPVIDFEPKGFIENYSKYDRLENLRLLIKLFENYYKITPIIYCSSLDYYIYYPELKSLSKLFWVNNFKSYLTFNNNFINQYKISIFNKELDFNESFNINKYKLSSYDLNMK